MLIQQLQPQALVTCCTREGSETDVGLLCTLIRVRSPESFTSTLKAVGSSRESKAAALKAPADVNPSTGS